MSEAVLLAEFAGFFDGARAGRLSFPHCGACGRFHWYPMPRCPHCQRAGWTWRQIAGPGEVISVTRVRHAFDKSRLEALPYWVAIVTFADAPGVRFVTNIAEAGADVGIGDCVTPLFPAPGAEPALVTFRLAAPTRSAP